MRETRKQICCSRLELGLFQVLLALVLIAWRSAFRFWRSKPSLLRPANLAQPPQGDNQQPQAGAPNPESQNGQRRSSSFPPIPFVRITYWDRTTRF